MEKDDLRKYCGLAQDLGAADAQIIETDQIIVREWVNWKCRFGCDTYGQSLMCPPHSPTTEDTKKLLKEYKHALLFRAKHSLPKYLAVELEKKMFLDGYFKALSFISGSCHLCEKCNIDEGFCLKPYEARPSMESCGISVFETARNAGYNLKVLKSREEEYFRYSLILIQ
jgi:predicted metal-binding protein